MKKIIQCRVPVRLDFGGGPTDMQPFPMESCGYVVNTTIDLYATATLSTGPELNGITIKSDDFSLSEHFDNIEDLDLSGSLSLIKQCIKGIGPQFSFELSTKSDVPPGSGLGSSTALTIAILKTFNFLQNDNFFNFDEIIKKSLEVENIESDKSSGGQDQYAAIFGGCNLLTFNKNVVKVDRLKIDDKIKNIIQNNSILCFSGSSHNSSTILSQVMSNFNIGDVETSQSLYAIKNAAMDISKSLINGDPDLFIENINLTFKNQVKLHKSIVDDAIKEIKEISFRFGAKAMKVSGAGGGGFVFILAEDGKRKKIEKALIGKGYSIRQFKFLDDVPEVTVV